MAAVVERLKYGSRGQGSLVKFGDSENWISCYSHQGREHRESTGTPDLKAARRWHKAKLDELGAARIGKATFTAPMAQRLTVGEILDAYQTDLGVRERGVAKLASVIKAVREAVGDRRASEIDAAVVDTLIARWRKAGKSASTVNHRTQVLGSAFRLARKRGLVQAVPEITKLTEATPRQVFYTPEEADRLIAAAPEYLRPALRFAYLTGWRRGDIVGLLWSMVDLSAKTITLPTTKNGKPRVIVLAGEVLDLIVDQEATRLVDTPAGPRIADHVFHRSGKSLGDFKKAFASAVRAAGLTDRKFHDFRRTGTRNLRLAGVPEGVAMTITGHKTRAVFERYNITSGADQRAAFEALANRKS